MIRLEVSPSKDTYLIQVFIAENFRFSEDGRKKNFNVEIECLLIPFILTTVTDLALFLWLSKNAKANL